jgi:periplasmic copper chaperone A
MPHWLGLSGILDPHQGRLEARNAAEMQKQHPGRSREGNAVIMRRIIVALAMISHSVLSGFAAQAQDLPPKDQSVASGGALKNAEGKNKGTKAISVIAPWSRATPGAAKTGAVYLEIRSMADVADKLLSASGGVADNIEIHNHINDNGIMQMRRVDAIDVAEGGSLKLVPGGYHIMLLGLKQPLKAGETFKLKLTFEKAGDIEVDVTVRPNNAASGKGSGSGMH